MKIYFDGHCDTLEKAFDNKKSLDFENYDFNLKDAKMNNSVIQNLAAFVHTEFEDGFKRGKDIVDYYFIDEKECVLIKNKTDLETVISDKKIGVILSIENGKAIEDDLKNIDFFFEKGVRIMGITWNDDNLLGCGCFSKNDLGLTDFGKEYVKKLEDKNIIIDISHSSEKTFWDIIKNTKKTIVATHSNCYGICEHSRNLKDDQIKEIAKRNRSNWNLFCCSFFSK